MSWQWKALLFGAVVLAHMAVIYGLGLSLSGGTLKPGSHSSVLDVKLTSFVVVAQPQARGAVPTPAISARINPHAGRRPAEDAFTTPPTRNGSDSYKTEEHQHLKAEDFFSPDEVDETANPVGNFEETLRQGLPLYIHGLVIEFWIDSNGNTVQVRCVEGDCSDAITADLDSLLASFFQPAVKNGLAVPSRKLIQIDPSPML